MSRTGPGPAVPAARSLIRLRIEGHRWLALAAVAAAGRGGLVYALWAPLGLGPGGASLDPPFAGLWRWFFALWLPGLFLVHMWLLAGRLPDRRDARGVAAGPRELRAPPGLPPPHGGGDRPRGLALAARGLLRPS